MMRGRKTAFNAKMDKVSLVSIIIIFLVSTFSNHICSENFYDLCKPFPCGNITFSFPFSRTEISGLSPLNCGLPGYQIACDSDPANAVIQLSGRSYSVKQLSLVPEEFLNSITVVDDRLIADLNSGSCESLRNLTISTVDVTPLALPSWGINLTLYRCPDGVSVSQHQQFFSTLLNFSHSCQDEDGYRLRLAREVRRNETQFIPPRLSPELPTPLPSGCQLVQLPVSRTILSSNGFLNSSDGKNGILLNTSFQVDQLIAVLREGFPLEWSSLLDCESCQGKGGRCAYDSSSRKVDCFCRTGRNCQQVSSHKQFKWKLILGVAIGGSVFLVAVVFLIFKFKRRASPFPFLRILNFRKKPKTAEDGRNAEQFMKEYRSTILAKYSYNDLKKMTGGFKDKLGEGGFGSVYRGKTPDGRPIAVKILERSSDHEMTRNFVNEVATIGRIHHLNVIRLLGFCWDGSKQALIYEYMPNGSLGDLLSKEGECLSLGLAKLLEISIGVAQGIEYLHFGCESRIVHLDIKPQNVLLDQNLIPKISDFGLAKISSRDQSAISITRARGTIGYIAPEIFMRNMGNPSHKSDAYSYGMLILDMIGGKKHQPSEISTSSENYFPNWIYDKLLEEEQIQPIDSVVEEEVGIAKKMVMVGLWCIQVDPRDRPSMTRVVEMLKGSVEAIQMPPKPFFFSPPPLHFEQQYSISDTDSTSLVLQDEISHT